MQVIQAKQRPAVALIDYDPLARLLRRLDDFNSALDLNSTRAAKDQREGAGGAARKGADYR